MALHKYYQVVDIHREDRPRFIRAFRTESEAAEYCNTYAADDYMGAMLFTIRPVWSNASEAGIKKLLREE